LPILDFQFWIDTPMERARLYLISGRVQGVGFRFFAENEANQLGLRGYVRNLSTGNVEVYATGEASALEEFKGRLARGPLGARVTRIEESEDEVDRRYSRFVIEVSG
jgi:acylphosphatase